MTSYKIIYSDIDWNLRVLLSKRTIAYVRELYEWCFVWFFLRQNLFEEFLVSSEILVLICVIWGNAMKSSL